MKKKTLESWCSLLILPILALLLYEYSKTITMGGDAWRVGDWLINYNAGPVRRGLLGSLFIWLNNFGWPLVWLVFATQAALYSALCIIVFAIYRATNPSTIWLILLLSPAFILFPFYSFEGGFRKEIITFVSFSALCLAYATRRGWIIAVSVATPLFVAGCFSHEANCLTLPFFLYMAWRGYQDQFFGKIGSAFFAILLVAGSTTAFAFAAYYRGDSTIAAGVCQSLLDRGLKEGVCQGAISWLNNSAAIGLEQVKNQVNRNLWPYLISLSIALSPILLIKGWRRETTLAFLAGFFSLIPLYIVAVDWGRWIHIFVFFLFCFAMAEGAKGRLQPRFQRAPILLILTYLTSWRIPHCCDGWSINKGFAAIAYEQLATLASRF